MSASPRNLPEEENSSSELEISDTAFENDLNIQGPPNKKRRSILEYENTVVESISSAGERVGSGFKALIKVEKAKSSAGFNRSILAELQKMNGTMGKMQGSLDTLTTNYNTLDKKVDKLNASHNTLNKKVDKLNASHSTLNKKVDNLNASHSILNKKVDNLNASHSTLNKKVDTLTADVGTLKNDMVDVKSLMFYVRVAENARRFERNERPLPVPFIRGEKDPLLPDVEDENDIGRLNTAQVKSYLDGYDIAYSANEERRHLKSKLRNALRLNNPFQFS
ncbi:hypothetical protein DAMA08_012920 [Martiniozyma asiatica (nom. inval.)]|nr:hypothetical protein DAMA08_012920 [Martiniozyma asiatica]